MTKADSFIKVGEEYFQVATDGGARSRLAEVCRGRGIEPSFDNNTDYFTSHQALIKQASPRQQRSWG